MMTEDGILTQQGSSTFWSTSTLYALRGASPLVMREYRLSRNSTIIRSTAFSRTHVPYPVEAYPEGSQRHLSGESALFLAGLSPKVFSE